MRDSSGRFISKFTPDAVGIGEMANKMDSVLEQAAQAIVTRAVQNAPVTTGRYRDSLFVSKDGDKVAAVSSDPFAHLVEFGSANNPPYRPLSRAVEDVGLIFRDGD